VKFTRTSHGEIQEHEPKLETFLCLEVCGMTREGNI